MSIKQPEAVDRLVGQRVRAARLAANMTQTDLAEHLGVSFQQVQKYEKGTNRMGSSRLTAIAAAVGRPVFWFFTGAETAPITLDDDSLRLSTTREGQRLAAAFLSLASDELRSAVVAMVEAAARLQERRQ